MFEKGYLPQDSKNNFNFSQDDTLGVERNHGLRRRCLPGLRGKGNWRSDLRAVRPWAQTLVFKDTEPWIDKVGLEMNGEPSNRKDGLSAEEEGWRS